jgi:hypothetical protein
METVKAIIQKSGGFARLKLAPIYIENGIHMPLVIEYLGKTGFRECDYFRVMQLETVDGKLVADIAVYFECNSDGSFWRPVGWQSDTDREKRYVYTPYELNDDHTITIIDMDEMRSLRQRANIWDEDVAALGYLAATPADPQRDLFTAV